MTSIIFRGLDLSLLNYADDVLNLSRAASMIENCFRVFSDEYATTDLFFKAKRSEVLTIRSACRPHSADTFNLCHYEV